MLFVCLVEDADFTVYRYIYIDIYTYICMYLSIYIYDYTISNILFRHPSCRCPPIDPWPLACGDPSIVTNRAGRGLLGSSRGPWRIKPCQAPGFSGQTQKKKPQHMAKTGDFSGMLFTYFFTVVGVVGFLIFLDCRWSWGVIVSFFWWCSRKHEPQNLHMGSYGVS